ncbi:hypothetical protein DM02DRAFT_537755, partial [Periconia macrospinosa]
SKKAKTYNSRYSLVVTHLTTNPPVPCLSTAERTGSAGFMVLWSYVIVSVVFYSYKVLGIWDFCPCHTVGDSIIITTINTYFLLPKSRRKRRKHGKGFNGRFRVERCE